MSVKSSGNVKEIFLAAIEIESSDDRDAFLNKECGQDESLRQRVDALLVAHERPESLLDRSTEEELPPTADCQAATENIGHSIGPYKIREQIGEGGMGSVFVAEQETPIRRKVALKIIKPGMDSKAVIARFEAERQALAVMDHPNIAKVLDAGTTDKGLPFFVMELVSGIEITRYSDEHKLSIIERLELFTIVCQAIQHAHQKGIIHRDVKPSNVLATEQDGKPVPKVIDFGVAKAVGQSLTGRTVYTSFQAVIGTPLYMSPEQAALSNVDVDTRSDVYSLGVLLYELLTGSTPFDRETLQSIAQDEVLRIIREKEPPKPSTKISSLGNRASSVSQERRTDIAGLGRVVRGDLDWIVMKALSKERSQRYDSASRLGEDIERFLKNEPVEARPPSITYRARKFYKRNKTLSLSTVVTLTVLSLGVSLLASKNKQLQDALEESDRQMRIVSDRTEQLQKVTFDYAFYDAVLSQSVNVRVLQLAESSLTDEQESALRALEAFYAGEHQQAIKLFQKADKSIATLSMLAWSQLVLGDDSGVVKTIDKVRLMSPASAEDHLMLGQLYSWAQPQFALVQIEKAIEIKGAASAISKVAYAHALVHSAKMEDQPRQAVDAARMINAARDLYPENQFVLARAVYINLVASLINKQAGDQESASRFRKLADESARGLPQLHFHIADLAVADEKYDDAMRLLENLIMTPNSFNTRYIAAALLAGHQHPAHARRIVAAQPDGFYRDIGLALLDAHDPRLQNAVKSRAVNILSYKHDSDARIQACEALLMARISTDEVSQLAAKYLGDTIDLFAPIGVFEYLAKVKDSGYVEPPKVDSPGERLRINFIRGLCFYSDGDWTEAEKLLKQTKECSLTGHIYMWSTYLLQKIQAATNQQAQ